MPGSSLYLAWLIISPVCLVTDILAIIVVCHYRKYFHGTDVTFLSLLVAMIGNAALLVLVPALLDYLALTWSITLCKFYVWAFITLRIVQLTNLVVLSFQWISILKLSSQKRNFATTFAVKMTLPLTWVCAGVVGLLPVMGYFPNTFSADRQCHFLSFDISAGFVVFNVILALTCAVLSVCCASDALLILRYVRLVACSKYGTSRFYEQRPKDIAGGYTVHERHSQLNFAWDVCNLILIVTLSSFSIHHCPYMIIQFLQLSGYNHRTIFEQTTLSLELAESLILPHLLWVCSRRYRHSLIYLWKTKILRRPGEDEDDPSSCVLQSYKRKIKRNSVMQLEHDNIKINQSTNNLSHDTSLPTSATITTQRGQETLNRNGEVINQVRPRKEYATVDLLNVGSIADIDQRSSENPHTIHRTLSGSSRGEWKEQMRKKHLPTIFVNEAFDAGDHKVRNTKIKFPVSLRKMDVDSLSIHSMYYYMSSDYHPDFLTTDSLPRHVHVQQNEYIQKGSDSWPRKVKNERNENQYQRNSLPKDSGPRICPVDFESCTSSLHRKKVPKMGTKCPESGSSSSIYSKSHSRNASEHSLNIQGHQRSASDFVPYDPSKSMSLSNRSCSLDEFEILDTAHDQSVDKTDITTLNVNYISKQDRINKTNALPPRQESDVSESGSRTIMYNDSDIEKVLNEASVTMAHDDETQYNVKKQNFPDTVTVPTTTCANLTPGDTELPMATVYTGHVTAVPESISQDTAPITNSRSTTPEYISSGEAFRYLLAENRGSTRSVSISSKYEEDIDRGFEDALNASYASRESLCSINDINLDDKSDSVANDTDPFGSSGHNSSDDFKTEAIVYTSLCEPSVKCNTSPNVIDYGFPVRPDVKLSLSPWPESERQISTSEMTFDNHFSDDLCSKRNPIENQNFHTVQSESEIHQDIEAVYL